MFLPKSIPKGRPSVDSWHRIFFPGLDSVVKPKYDWNQVFHKQNVKAVLWISYTLALLTVSIVLHVNHQSRIKR